MCIIFIVSDPFLSLDCFSCGYWLLVIWVHMYSHFVIFCYVLSANIFVSVYCLCQSCLFFCFKYCFVLIIVYGQTCPFCLFVSGLFIVMFWMVFPTWRLWKLSPIFLPNILCFKLSHLNVEYTGNLFSYNEWIKEKTDFFCNIAHWLYQPCFMNSPLCPGKYIPYWFMTFWIIVKCSHFDPGAKVE